MPSLPSHSEAEPGHCGLSEAPAKKQHCIVLHDNSTFQEIELYDALKRQRPWLSLESATS